VADESNKNAGVALGIAAGVGLLAAIFGGGKSKPKTGTVAGAQALKLRKTGCNCGR
jgi:hypothetical protein